MELDSIIIVLLISVASNLDNAGVGISYGIRDIHIPVKANAMIAFISAVATLIGGAFGSWLTHWIKPTFAHLIGTIVIVSVGIWVLCQPMLKNRSAEGKGSTNMVTQILRTPEKADRDESKSISFTESITLGIALSMNALAGGFDVGVTDLNIFLAALFVGIISFLMISVCCWIGRRFVSDKIGDKATILSGLLLIYIGLLQIL